MIALAILTRQMGHFLKAGAQEAQQHKWPHGIKTISASLSRQILHFLSSISSRTRASMDGVVPTSTKQCIANHLTFLSLFFDKVFDKV